MNVLYGVLLVLGVGLAAWLLTAGIWWLLKSAAEATGLDEKIDHALDVEGGLDAADYIKFKEQHAHGGRG